MKLSHKLINKLPPLTITRLQPNNLWIQMQTQRH